MNPDWGVTTLYVAERNQSQNVQGASVGCVIAWKTMSSTARSAKGKPAYISSLNLIARVSGHVRAIGSKHWKTQSHQAPHSNKSLQKKPGNSLACAGCSSTVFSRNFLAGPVLGDRMSFGTFIVFRVFRLFADGFKSVRAMAAQTLQPLKQKHCKKVS